ncbi:VanZ family protein [Psychrobium sp. 1_MG-2023]|uniref:VanZ family protein n=1 Tax=Psychrobium sp. 1_MG-2023 TaxID=3062624 RepID=UPI000C335E70|nr:VanZ family protein [Psychrobium sp. 1_MG-2023]MDP2560036.1 VanZ family protein [Psychrobium sp. 1_MG-2023]PKF56302.1 teicoplanin resistance protein VanZ [Alteromonadales bacterium alter-6D02]
MKRLIQSLWQNSALFRMALFSALVVFSYLFFSQQNIPQTIAHTDKYGHAIAFFVLSALLYKSRKFSRFSQITLLIGYGALVEIIQHFIPYRSASLADVAADAAGVLLFHLIALIPWVQKKLD